MLKINFLPESDREDYSEVIDYFENFWNKRGIDIVNALEKHSGKAFKETVINATISRYQFSHSHPLHLRSTTPLQYRLIVLIHELGHRVLAGCLDRRINPGLESHQLLYLILADVVKDVLSEQGLDDLRTWEIESGKPDHYNKAWEWASQFDTYEKRQEKLQELYNTKPSVIT